MTDEQRNVFSLVAFHIRAFVYHHEQSQLRIECQKVFPLRELNYQLEQNQKIKAKRGKERKKRKIQFKLYV